MNRIKKIILIQLLLLLSWQLLSQPVSFTAQAKTNVVIGERFNITYTINAQVNSFKGPQINGLNVLSGPNQSSSTSVQFINGQMTQSVTLSYSYIVQAIKEGTFNIPAATVNVNGQEYQSNSLTINVVAGSSQQQTQQQNQQQNQQQTQKTQQTSTDEEIFLKASVDKSSVVQGEQIIVTYKIYTSIPVSQYTIDKLASFNGFWSENLSNENERPKQTNEVIKGINYTVADIYRVALFPQRSGSLKIEPLGVECIVQKRTQRQRQNNIFDDFFFNPFFESVQNVKLNLKSNTLTINVSALPSQNRTADFSGTVGTFTLTSEIDKTELKVNDAATLKIKLTGKGNLKLIEDPKLNFPPNLETYAPKVSDNINVSPSGISGSRTFEYLIIPRSGGEFKIPPYNFSFYNPATKTYETQSTKEITLNVEKGDGVQQGTAVSQVSREDVQYIGSDIRFIKSDIFPLITLNYNFYTSDLYLVLLLVPVILFVLFIIIWRRQIKLSSNAVLVKNRKANKMAQGRLKQAHKYMLEQKYELFYDEVSKALWGYLSYKFNISFADLSKDAVNDTFKSKNVPEELSKLFINVLDECEFARFAPGDKTHIVDTIYKQAIDIIIKIEKALK